MVYLTEPESRYYNDLFTLCDVDGNGKVSQLKCTELFRSSQIENSTLSQIYQLSAIFPSSLYLSRSQFYSCLKLIGANQASLPLREEILTSETLQIPLPKFSWVMELEPPPQIVDAPLKSAQNGFASGGAHHSSRRSPDLIQLSAKELNSSANNVAASNSDIPSTDSELEATDNEREVVTTKRLGGGPSSSVKHSKSKRGGSPETWSTASESPTPTNSTHNSVAERPWAVNSQSWQGLLCEEQRQLLGTEEESSDKHSSEDEDEEDLETLYLITPEQRDYYLKQFKTVQPDLKGLLSGTVARVFFEKSRIPVEELRHIWQLCDVTRDGALDVTEFTAAMHLVVLRRNNIPIPSTLPSCLQPPFLHKLLGLPEKKPAPAEGDLLHLESDDNQETGARRRQQDEKNDYQRMVSSTYDELPSSSSKPSSATSSVVNKSSTLPKNHYSQHQRLLDGSGDASAEKQQTTTTSSKNHVIATKNRSNSRTPPSPPSQVAAAGAGASVVDGNKEWTKFAESPTSNVSSPGPKPVNVTTNIIDPSQVIHPVALRVTPVGMEIADDDAQRTFRTADNLVYESGIIRNISANDGEKFKKPNNATHQHYQQQRDSLPSDLRAIQRPHPKKSVSKNIGTIPLPPIDSNNVTVSTNSSTVLVGAGSRKEVPPLPPPRPHRHTRSSSLDLKHYKLTNSHTSEKQVNNNEPPSTQPPELPPPRLEKTIKMASVDTGYIAAPKEESFADFTHFPDQKSGQHQQQAEYVTTIRLDSQPPLPQPRANLALIGPSSGGSQRNSAFEVYRKPSSKSRDSQSPPVAAATAASQVESSKTAEYEKQVHAISDSLRQVRFKNSEQNAHDVLKHLKDQNILLMRLCKDLNDELMTVQRRKEEFRGKLDHLK